MGRLEKIKIHLRASFWFVPSLMVLGAIGLAILTIEADIRFEPALGERWPRLFGVSPEGARGILEAIAGSMITVTSITFSMTIVALSMASNQYTPRILRNFMRDPGTRLVLGVFVAVFTYSLIVMRTIRSGPQPFVPAISITTTIALAMCSIGFLVYFIHHIATVIQAQTIIESISNETVSAVEKEFPADPPEAKALHFELPSRCEWSEVQSQQSGYLQSVGSGLLKLAEEHELCVRVERKIGEFIVAGTLLLSVTPAIRLDPKLTRKLQSCVIIDNFRTVEQDPSYGIRQLVDIAMKALSPGINDTTTAINVVDYLSPILHLAVQRKVPTTQTDKDRTLRVILQKPLNVERLLDEALLQIRQSGRENPAILLRLLKVIHLLATVARPEYRPALLKHVRLVDEAARQHIDSRADLDAVMDRVQRTADTLLSAAALKPG
ncbi:MAG: DUF2254 domain-containing protein [Verrucomicrobiota bacterium]